MEMASILGVLCVCVLQLTVTGSASQSTSLEASPACGGEIHLLFKTEPTNDVTADGDPKHVVKRDTEPIIVGVSFKPVDAGEDVEEEYKEFAGTPSSSSFSAMIRGLTPGKNYQLRSRHGRRDGDTTEWEEYGDAVEASSGTVSAEEGPAGVGQSSRTFCQSRRRPAKNGRAKTPRTHRATFTSGGLSSRRRRTYSYNYNDNYYSYYSSYSYYNYYDYYYSGGSVAGPVAGGVIGFIFIVVAIVICCRFYYYGGCGQPAYRARYNRMNTTVITTTGVQQQRVIMAQPATGVVMPNRTVVPAYTPGGVQSPQQQVDVAGYPQRQLYTAYPVAPQATMENTPAYPAAGQDGAASVWGGTAPAQAPAAPPYPTGASAAAPPAYNESAGL